MNQPKDAALLLGGYWSSIPVSCSDLRSLGPIARGPSNQHGVVQGFLGLRPSQVDGMRGWPFSSSRERLFRFACYLADSS